MAEWPVRELGDLCSRITVGHVGSMASRYVPRGVPFLRSQNVKPGRIDLSSLAYIDEGFHVELSKSQLRAGDLVIVRTGVPGVAAVIPEGIDSLNCADLVIARPKPGVNVQFLCYAINETAGSFIRAHTVGAVQQHFNVASAKRMTLKLPSLAEQRAIVEVLGALDDKIGVNARIAASADDLANHIFGRRTRDSRLVALSEFVEPILGGTPDRKVDSYWGLGIPWASAKDVANAASGVVADTAEQITKEAVNSTRVKPLPERSVVLTARGTVGAVARLAWPMAINQSCYAFRSSEIPPAILFHLVRKGAENILGVAHGTVFSTVNMKTFDHILVPMVEVEARPGLEDDLACLHRQIEAHIKESRVLADLRDTLLPQLMSGKLRVRDAEKIVEDAV
ncbi:restriction endonuclease subunit S [Streptomyces sp. NPDC047000]|uniref:restriction endonuclease subunit S n=1 Tax=Streptomyces sp. NPDC047000 TaxID=3155474 RepID=UPI0033FEADD3